ncbi:MAG TPA: phosphonate ABC transporter, permease protein PhnE [Casimicrobiaceae bacterium]|nr:phosphonate ABC transporter, permease protein PhnE [Casimicrobiaceae bacterium]
MRAAEPPQSANSAPSGGSEAAKPRAWGDHASAATLRGGYDRGTLDERIAELGRARARSRRGRALLWAVLLGALAWTLYAVVADTDWGRLSAGSIARTLKGFAEVDVSLFPTLVDPAIDTALMATLASLLGLFMALFVAWLGAANITPLGRFSYMVGRSLMTLSRSVHEIVWGLIFVSAVGLGALAGVLAMAVRSIGFISKVIAEAIEDVQPGPIEAMRSVGANRFQVLWYGIVPQVIPVVLGTVIFEWDINIRRATIMGLVGAGGLGLVLFRQMATFNYGGITSVLIAVLLLIIFGEVVSHHVRKAVI